MSVGMILAYLSSLFVSLFIVFMVHRLYRRFRHDFLAPFLFFVVLDILYTLIDFVMIILPKLLLKYGMKGHGLPTEGNIFVFYAVIPLEAFAVYFFISALISLLDLPFNRRFFTLLWSIYSLMFILYLWGIGRRITMGDVFQLIVSRNFTLYLLSGIMLLMMLYGLFFAIREKAGEKRRFYLFYIANYLMTYGLISLFGTQSEQSAWLSIYLVGGFHLPVLALMPRFLLITQSERQPLPVETLPLAISRGRQLGLSSREQEILGLILKGLTNREIEDRLFISRRTVENHVYKIYRKLRVSNRVQLVNRVSEPEPKVSAV